MKRWGISAIAAPLVVYGISSAFVGNYGASPGRIAGLLAIASLYVFTVCAMAILVNQLLGKQATVGVMALVVFLGFPASGGTIPASMLPAFWRAMHQFYFSAGAMESFRSLIYFDGIGLARWLLQLGLWTIGIVLVTGLVHQGRRLHRQRELLADLEAALSDAPPHRAAHPAPVGVGVGAAAGAGGEHEWSTGDAPEEPSWPSGKTNRTTSIEESP